MTEATVDPTRAMWRSLVGALAIGALGDLYLLWGHISASAFGPFALVVPCVAAALLIAIVVGALRAAAPYDRGAIAMAVGLLGTVGLLALLNLVPPVARDEMTHHLAIPALYVRHQRIFEVAFAEQSYYPMLLDMLYTPMLAWLPDNAPKFLHLLFGVGAAAWVVLLLRRQATGAAALFGGWLLLSTPVVMALGASAYVDLGILFYATGALAAVIVWADAPQTRWLIAGALMAGLAGATKYNGLMVIPLLATAPVWLAPPGTSEGRKLSWALLFGVVALIPLAPWLVKNALETGNPIFPLFNSLLHGRSVPAYPRIGILAQRRMIYGDSWFDIALIPLRIFVTGRDGDPARFDGVFNPLLLLGLVGAFTAAAPRQDRFIGIYSCVYALLAFFLMTLRVRYSIAIVAPLALLTVDQLIRMRAAGGTHRMLATTAAISALLFSLGHAALLWQRLDPVPYLLGQLSRDEYIGQFVPEYPVLQFANRELPPTARLYLAFLGNRSYYCQRDFVSDMFFLPVTLRDAITNSTDPSGIARQFSQSRITHIVAVDELLERYMGESLTEEQSARWHTFAQQHLQPLSQANGVTLYAVGTT